MIRRITLDNFMSHARTVIEPAEGLTVLVGPNNCGKSAVITALQTLCYNERGGFMMRHGETECCVTVETDDGHSLQWIRTKKSVRYVIDGREVDRLRGSIPDDLHDHLRLPLVESADGTGEFDIHFGEQKRPIFLLDQNGRQAAAFFASSSDAALLMEMQAQHKKRVADRRQDERTLAAELERHQRLLGTLEPIPDLVQQAEGLRDAHAELTGAAETLARLEADTQTLLIESNRVDGWQRSHDELQKLTIPPELAETTGLAELAEELESATRSLHGELARHGALIGLPAVPAMAPAEETAELVKQLAELQRETDRAARSGSVLVELESPPALAEGERLERSIREIIEHESTVARHAANAARLGSLVVPHTEEDTQTLAGMIDGLAGAQQAERNLSSLHSQLASLHEPPEPQEILAGTDLVASLDGASCQVASLIAELEAIDQRRQDALSELFSWAEQNPTCPICGAAVDPDRLFACHDGSAKGAAS